MLLGKGLLQDIGDDVRWLVDVAETVRLVDDHEIPCRGVDIGGLVAGELVGADDDGVCDLEGAEAPRANGGVVGLCLQNHRGQEELL